MFPTTSVHNLLLIATQRPTATRVPGFYAWQQLGRFVKMGEHGLMILAPVPYKAAEESSDDGPVRVGFRVVCVFHVAQTEGARCPTGCCTVWTARRRRAPGSGRHCSSWRRTRALR